MTQIDPKAMQTKPYLILLVVAGGVALVLRLLFLTSGTLFLDEVFTIWRAESDFATLFKPTTFDANPPLAYLVYKFWVWLFGGGEFAYECVSVVFGTLSVLLIAQLVAALLDRRTAIVSAFLLAISVFHISHSQQVRGYSLAVFLLLCTSFFFIRMINDDNARYGRTLFAASALLYLYSHYWAIPIVFSFVVFTLIRFRRNTKFLRRVAWLLPVIAIGTLPSLYDVYMQYFVFYSFFWIADPSWAGLYDVLRVLNSQSGVYMAIAAVLLLLLFVARRDVVRRNAGSFLFLFAWLLVPALIVLVASIAGKSFMHPRYFIFCLAPYIVLTASAITCVPSSRLQIALVGGLFLATLFPLKEYYRWRIDTADSKDVFRHIAEHYEDGDIVLHTSLFGYLPSVYYHGNALDEFILAEVAVDRPEVFWPDKSVLIESTEVVNYRRIWLYWSRGDERKLAQFLRDSPFQPTDVNLFPDRPSHASLLRARPIAEPRASTPSGF